MRGILFFGLLASLAPGDARAGSKALAQRLYEEGVESYRRGDLAGSLSSLGKSISEYNGLLPAYAARAQARHALGDEAGMRADVQRALSIGSLREAETFLARGTARLLDGDVERALADFNAALSRDPEYADGFLARGRAHRARGDLAAAVADWTKALKLDPELLMARYNLGLALSDAGRKTQAVDELTRTLRQNPKFPLAYGALGAIFAARGDLERAHKAYSKGIFLHPDYAYAYLGRAMVRLNQGKRDLAFKDLDEAARCAPGDYAPWYNRGEVLLREGKREEALDSFRKAVKARLSHPPAALAMGDRFMQAGLPKDAVEAYGRAVEAAERLVDPAARDWLEQALLSRARGFQMLSDDQRAMRDLTMAVAVSSASPAAWTARGKLHLKLEQLAKAEGDIRQAMRHDHRYAPGLMAWGSLQAKRGMHQDAMKAFDAAIEADAGLAEAYNNRGVLYATVYNDFDKAVADIEKAVSLDRDNPGFHLNLGAARIKRNDPWRAIEALDEALRQKAEPTRVLQLRAEAHFSLGNRTKAYLDINDAIRAAPKSATLHASLGFFRLRSREFPQAVQALSRAASLDRRHARAFLLRGQAYAGLGDLRRAISDFDRAASLDKRPLEALTLLCQAERLKGRHVSALASCSRAIAISQEHAPAYVQRGLAHLALGEFSKAARDLDDGTRLGPPHAAALLARSLAHAALGQYRESDRAYREAMVLDPQRRIADIGFYGEEAGGKWDYYARIEALDKRLVEDADDPHTFLVRGNGFHNAGYYDKAILEYTRAMEMDGGIAAAYAGRGAALAAQDSLDAAESDLRRAVEMEPKDAQAHLALITLLTARSKYAEGLKAAVAAARLHPREPEIFIKAGNLRYFLKDMARARDNFALALKIDPDNAAAFNGIGLCGFAQRRYPEAVEQFSRAVNNRSDHDRYYRNRASTYVNMGDYANAAADYRLALASNRDPEQVNEYQRLIQSAQARIAASR